MTFQIPIGLPALDEQSGIVCRVVDLRNVPPMLLYYVHLRGRALPVAAARFVQQMMEHSKARFECNYNPEPARQMIRAIIFSEILITFSVIVYLPIQVL